MRLTSDKVSFGRHETFVLRYGWLSKGFTAVSKNPKVFESDDSTVDLGVGKNMVAAIHYWLRATQMIHPTKNKPTELGELIFKEDGGFDSYLEDEATVWLLHWLLATNPERATSCYWFFNEFHKQEFTGQELTAALSDFIDDKIYKTKRPSASTRKNDTQLLHRMYTQSKGNTRMPLEEALDSPLASLGLMTQTAGGRSFQSKPEPRPNLPTAIFAFSVAQLFKSRSKDQDREITELNIEELLRSKEGYAAPGCVFRLTEIDLMNKLEDLVNYIPNIFEIRETAGLQQIYKVGDIEPEDYLKAYYGDLLFGVAV